MRLLALCTLALAVPQMVWADAWSATARAEGRDGTVLVTCRSKLSGEYLLVELQAADGWHVYAMDNERRAKEALAGKMSLGVEESTEVLVGGGLRVIGDWYQSDPQDFSQPKLRWYSYGFEGTALMAARVERTGSPTAEVTVRAQACDNESCVRVDAVMNFTLSQSGQGDFRPADLVPVRLDSD